ncbi:hypothetical protein FRC04_002880 [Tulasnella sp. 424]|nr:hypothetical protein FRC04_002880 [Tulasnella sp. 424]
MLQATRFGIPCSRSLWKETLRIWRENGLQELGPKFTQAGYEDPDRLYATCTASIDERNQSMNSVLAQDLPGACHEVLRMLGMPNSHLEWTVVLTWLALLLEPISANSELPCLENAFKAASRKVARQPGRHHFGDQEQRWPEIHAPRRALSTAPTIWKAGTALNPVESLKDFFRSHASHEVAFILGRYLPCPIRDTLEDMLVQLQLLSTASQEAQSKGSAIDDASGLEGTPSKRQCITEKARGKRPSVSGRPEKCPASGTSSGLLQGTIAPWKGNTGSGSTAGPSSTSRAQGVGARPSTYFDYRTNSDASLASPATPLARSPRNPSSPSTGPWWTGVSSVTPDLLAGEEDNDKVGSLMESLAGLSIKSPGSKVNHSPRNVGKSRLSANNDDGNPFIEPATGNSTGSAEVVRDSPKQWSVGLSGEGTNDSAVEDDASSIVEEIRCITLREYLADHPYDDVKSFDDLFLQNKIPEATLEVMAGIMGHPYTL